MAPISADFRPINALPPFPPTPPSTAEAKAAAEGLIKQVDAHTKHVLDTPLENALLHHWIEGSGQTYRLSVADMAGLANTPDALAVGKYIAANGSAAAGDTVNLGRYQTTLKPVTLENGRPGYRADLDFNPDRNAAGNPYNGSIGRGRVYFDQAGKAVGVLDSYDFSNDSIVVDGINSVGASVGAKNFELRGGVIERSHDLVVPSGPDFAASAGGVLERAGVWAARKGVGFAADAVIGAERVADWALRNGVDLAVDTVHGAEKIAGWAERKTEELAVDAVHAAGGVADWVRRLPVPPFFGPFSI